MTFSAEQKAAHAETKRLRSLVERPERAWLWGQRYTITPRLIAAKFGDGQKLVCVTPMATRPNFFVVRIDSRIDRLDGGTYLSEEAEISLLEEIMLAAEDEYGRFGIDDDGEQIKGDDDRWFPVCDWGVGCAWGKPFAIDEWKPTPDPRYPTNRQRTRARWRKQGRRG